MVVVVVVLVVLVVLQMGPVALVRVFQVKVAYMYQVQ